MVADIEKALKYPFNFKPLFIFGIIFVIAMIVFIVPLFWMYPQTGKEDKYLFNWNEIPGRDNERLIEYLKLDHGIDWGAPTRIEKIDDNRMIRVYNETDSLTLRIDDQRTRVLLIINNSRTHELSARLENGDPAIYEKAKTEENTAFIIIYSSLLLASMIIISTLFSGYLVSVSRNMISGNIEKAPELTDIRNLFIDGLKFLVIGGIYTLPPIIIIIFFMIVSTPLGILFMFFLIPLFFVPHLGAAHFAYTKSMKKALDIGFIYSLVFRNIKEYSLSLFIYFIIFIVFYIASMLIITYPFVIVANYVAGQYIFTIFYIEAMGFKDNIASVLSKP